MESNGTRRKVIGVALLGAGRIGSVHFGNLVRDSRLELLWVVDEVTERAQELVNDSSCAAKVTNCDGIDKVLRDQSVLAVMVCTPSGTHKELVTKALRAGKAVFCEKPLALSLESTQECYDLAEEVNQPLFCAFNRRWDPQCRRIKDLIQSGHVGQLRVVKTVSRDPPGMATEEYIKTSGGIFIDSAVHDMDMLCWVVGEYPKSIYATGHATNPLYSRCGDVDSCSITLKFPSGVLGLIEVSREAPVGYFQYLEVLGTDGMLHTEHPRHTRVTHWSLDGTSSEPLVSMLDRYRESYLGELDHFLGIVQGM
ncbi:hypothetical protein CAPTEDRAFT_135479 [Capitella teleta]|uniref:Gfo/Idh/MocA-like oxidoreductase N-terminal domain-containing protein n=1 Tax=Capitella teleta TaxID=283909 RepID=R7TD03_CAPTE|nr:hypothetical protein CAPTEDRAFT_135479 [Capitella teleta]|eukprot:ELT88951.1 hypothetical protein CAPTEDRAFT_135479 [Capitella teleta]